MTAIPPVRPIDWVVSNPPYIPSAEIAALAPEVSRHEPRLALDGGTDGLDVVRRLVQQAAARVREGVLLEIGAGQAQETARILAAAGFVDITVRADLGGVERVVAGRVATRGGGV